MFGLGTSELLIILFIVLLVFGGSRLPELGKGLGAGMRSFRDALRGPDTKNSNDSQSPTNQDGNKPS